MAATMAGFSAMTPGRHPVIKGFRDASGVANPTSRLNMQPPARIFSHHSRARRARCCRDVDAMAAYLAAVVKAALWS
jgi:hypothetical protein